MSSWIRSHVRTGVVVGLMAAVVVGGAAFAVAGPLSGLDTAATQPQTLASNQMVAGLALAAPCASNAKSSAGTSGATASASLAVSGTSTGKASCGKEAPRLRALARLMRRTIHAQLTVKGKGGAWVTVDVDRGTVQSISTTSITIVRPDGVDVSAKVSSQTRFFRVTESGLAKGAHAVVVQTSGEARAVIAFGLKAGRSTGASGT